VKDNESGIIHVSYEKLNNGKHPAKFVDAGFRNEMSIDTSTNMIWSEDVVIR
jgi:hypothetical protein